MWCWYRTAWDRKYERFFFWRNARERLNLSPRGEGWVTWACYLSRYDWTSKRRRSNNNAFWLDVINKWLVVGKVETVTPGCKILVTVLVTDITLGITSFQTLSSLIGWCLEYSVGASDKTFSWWWWWWWWKNALYHILENFSSLNEPEVSTYFINEIQFFCGIRLYILLFNYLIKVKENIQ